MRLFRKHGDGELDEELRFHVEKQIEANIAAGMSADEARRQALSLFGGVEAVKEECRDARPARLLADLLRDLRYSLRQLRRSPGFTAVAVITLALGIAATTAVFSIVNAFLIRPLPFDRPDQLVHIWQTDRQQGAEEERVSAPNFRDWTEQNKIFSSLGAYYYQERNITRRQEQASRVQIGVVTPNLPATLGIPPLLGRNFTEEDGTPGHNRVVLLSYNYWNRYLGGERNTLGRSILLDGVSYTIVGVMPPQFVFPMKATQLWTPLVLQAEGQKRAHGGLLVVGRLRPGATRQSAQAEMQAIAERQQRLYPEENRGLGVRVVPLRSALLFFYDAFRLASLLLLVAVGFVLLIVCANVGNLLLARGLARTREFAVRASLGASRVRLVRQLLAEALLLSMIGGTAGLLGVAALSRLLSAAFPEDLYRAGEISVDGWVVAFALAASVLAAFLFGLAPALQTTRPNLASAAREDDPRGAIPARRLRSALVIWQVALAMVLLAGSALALRSFLHLQDVKLGFSPRNVLTMELVLPESKYPGAKERNAFEHALLDRVAALPGVESAATVYPLPLNFESMQKQFAIDGPPLATDERLYAGASWVSPDYFAAMQTPIVKGGALTRRDDASARPAVVINQAMADRFWPAGDAVGKEIRVEGPGGVMRAARIAGIASNSKGFLLNEAAKPHIYVGQEQEPTRRKFLVVRCGGTPAAFAPALRAAVGAVDGDLPVTNVRSMDRVVAESSSLWAIPSALLGLLGLAALLLAAMGIYGVVSYTVRERTREIGIRVALGAERRDVIRLVLRQAVPLLALGACAGLAGAFVVTRSMVSFLYAVSPADPLSFTVVTLVLAGTGLLASYFPARRASRADPMRALRGE